MSEQEKQGLRGVIEVCGVLVENIMFYCKPHAYSDTVVVVAKDRSGDSSRLSFNLHVYHPMNEELTFINRWQSESRAIRKAIELCSEE